MTVSEYIHGHSFIHRTPPGLKILILAVLGTLLFVFPNMIFAAASLAIIVMLYPLAGISPKVMLAQISRSWPFWCCYFWCSYLWLTGNRACWSLFA
jgi:energy-coupling factor transporter transmembrane protein EcfT